MSEIQYCVGGPSWDGKYGIIAINREEKHYAAAMPFLREREDAERLVNYLHSRQMPISEFCDAFTGGSLMEMI